MATETQGAAGGASQTLESASLLDEILAETKMTPGDEGYEVAKRGVQAFIAELVAPKREGEKVDKAFVDALIAEIDQKLSVQVDEIIHNPVFQKLESAWRGLKFVVDRTDFRENIKVELLNCSKEDLLADFEDSP
jgi:type VI secretion system protein ImpC